MHFSHMNNDQQDEHGRNSSRIDGVLYDVRIYVLKELFVKSLRVFDFAPSKLMRI
jgi:hypothetical protein